MTDAELNTLYDTTDTSSFGSLLSTENQIIHDFHGCFEYTTKCSEGEIAGQQWGSSNVTHAFYAPYTQTPFLNKVSDSIHDSWGLLSV